MGDYLYLYSVVIPRVENVVITSVFEKLYNVAKFTELNGS